MRKIFLVLLLVILALGTGYAWKGQNSEKFYSVDIATVSANSEYTTVSRSVSVWAFDTCSIHAYGTAQSTSATGDINFYFATSPDGSSWDTEPFTYFTVVIDSTDTATMAGALIDISGVRKIRVLKVENENPSDAIYDVNVWIGLKEK